MTNDDHRTRGPFATPPGVLSSSSLRVFDLSLGEMLWSRRTIFMALVVGGAGVHCARAALAGRLGAPFSRAEGRRGLDERPGMFGLMIWGCTSASSCRCSASSTARR